MKILSLRKGFQGDHSSTSYEFYAVDKPLNKSEQTQVSKLSSRARPTKRHVSFIYNGEWSNLPGGWEPLVEKYYDVMYTESYDWWTLAIAFNTNEAVITELKKYEFYGTEDLGVRIHTKGDRVIISILCFLEPGMAYDEDYSDYDDDYDEWEDEEDIEEIVEPDNNLLNLLKKNREYLMNGDYRLLYGVWDIYKYEPDDDDEYEQESPPVTDGMDNLPEPVRSLLSMMVVL